jgi:hypothetical protein
VRCRVRGACGRLLVLWLLGRGLLSGLVGCIFVFSFVFLGGSEFRYFEGSMVTYRF